MVVGIVLVVTTPFRVENAEDNAESLERFNRVQYKQNDVVIEVQPQGTTPYVIGGLQSCNEITLSREASLATLEVHS
jgi:N-acetylmuramic acid 6-phosphate etherase